MRFLIPILTILCVSVGFTQAQEVESDFTHLGLPDGAKARLGKSNIARRNGIALHRMEHDLLQQRL